MFNTHNAQRACLAEPDRPTSDTAHVTSVGRIEAHGNKQLNSATDADPDKAFHNLRACLSLAGYGLQILNDGDTGAAYLVSRWNMSRTLPSMGAVAAFADQLGVPT